MKNRILGLLLAVAMLGSSIIPVSATESTNPYYAEGENNTNPLIASYATGLISTISINFTVSGRTLNISGGTSATETMGQVGFKNVKVERSSNGTSWAVEKNLGDFLSSSKITHLLSTSTTVQGGYYYRVTCTHYAKKSQILLPPTQSIDNWTSYVWIS